jgi:hypothetical protein
VCHFSETNITDAVRERIAGVTDPRIKQAAGNAQAA